MLQRGPGYLQRPIFPGSGDRECDPWGLNVDEQPLAIFAEAGTRPLAFREVAGKRRFVTTLGAAVGFFEYAAIFCERKHVAVRRPPQESLWRCGLVRPMVVDTTSCMPGCDRKIVWIVGNVFSERIENNGQFLLLDVIAEDLPFGGDAAVG